MDSTPVRIDKWLWAVRLFKTRTLAAEACKASHVEIAGFKVKPSREVKIDEVISAKIGVITRTVKVLGLIERRVGAKLAKLYIEDLTPNSEYEKLKESRDPSSFAVKGFGRPTKKDRRAMEQFFSPDAK